MGKNNFIIPIVSLAFGLAGGLWMAYEPPPEPPPLAVRDGKLTDYGYWSARNEYKACAKKYGNGQGCWFRAAGDIEPDKLTRLVIAYDAQRHNVDVKLAKSIASAESGTNPFSRDSHAGAVGLMQVMPNWGKKYKLDLKNPFENSEAAHRILKTLTKRYKGNPAKIASAYNAGEGATNAGGGIAKWDETRAYVAVVIGKMYGDLK